MLGVCQRVAAIPMKRAAPAETHFLERDEVEQLFPTTCPGDGRLALRDRALLLFLYNTGARAQEVADLRVEHLDLGEHPLVRLHGKGDKWRTCPLWQQTADLAARSCSTPSRRTGPQAPVFSANGQALTRFGIYKIVRRHAGQPRRPQDRATGQPAPVPPHRGRSPPRGRRRGQRHPRLARPRRSHHHQPLRRDQHQGEASRPSGHRASRFFGGIPHTPRSGGPTNRCSNWLSSL